MIDETDPFANPPVPPPEPGDAHAGAPIDAPSGQPAGDDGMPTGAMTPPPTEASAAVLKFKSCRWRSDPEAGEFCTHRDVLPFAGKASFNPESWCPECAFYKLRRTPKKRERVDYSY